MRRALAVIVLLTQPGAASAQETPRFGLVFAFPASVGVAIKVSDRITIRPDIVVTKTSSDTTTTITVPILFPADAAPIATTRTTTADSWSASAGLSALLYLAPPDAFRTYVAPRFAYSRASSTIPLSSITFDSSGAIPTTTTATTTSASSNYDWSGSFGAQYALGQRFVVFGEVGPRYRRSTSSPIVTSFSRTEAKAWSVGIQGGVGVIVYFGS